MDTKRIEERIQTWDAPFQPDPSKPIRRILSWSPEQAVVAWQVEPGQVIETHRHPEGQDTWIVLEGQGLYASDAVGTLTPIGAGQVVVAPKGAFHGLENTGGVSFKFLSVVSPAEAGFEPLQGA